MAEYTTPGIYIEEIPGLPPSIHSVETAIPAFIGYTEKARLKEDGDLLLIPCRISSLAEYKQYFGNPFQETGIEVLFTSSPNPRAIGKIYNPSRMLMNYSLELFFANGGGPCYIVSVGNYTSPGGKIVAADLEKGLKEVSKTDEVTIILFPDGLNLATSQEYYDLCKVALDQCSTLHDRFVIMDLWMGTGKPADHINALRNYDFGPIDTRRYGAVYYPRIYTTLDYYYSVETAVKITGVPGADTLAILKSANNAYYVMAKTAIKAMEMLLPPSCAVAGRYADVDNSRGVWKAPANIGLTCTVRPEIIIGEREQETLNVDTNAGKSINAIRSFPGRGPAIIWGARTLAGNDNEWRYVPVRRFFNMVEESVKKSTVQFVFEPNDNNTWIRVKAMIENYLHLQWIAGALMGASPKDAFFVHVGLGQTMTAQDILEGRLVIEIGLAVLRPAEFIILRFMHKMQSET